MIEALIAVVSVLLGVFAGSLLESRRESKVWRRDKIDRAYQDIIAFSFTLAQSLAENSKATMSVAMRDEMEKALTMSHLYGSDEMQDILSKYAESPKTDEPGRAYRLYNALRTQARSELGIDTPNTPRTWQGVVARYRRNR